MKIYIWIIVGVVPRWKSFITSAANGSVAGIWQLGDHTKYPSWTEWLTGADDGVNTDGNDDDDGGNDGIGDVMGSGSCGDGGTDDTIVDADALKRIREYDVDMFAWMAKPFGDFDGMNGITFGSEWSAGTAAFFCFCDRI